MTIKIPTLKPAHSTSESNRGNYPTKIFHLTNAERDPEKKSNWPKGRRFAYKVVRTNLSPHFPECFQRYTKWPPHCCWSWGQHLSMTGSLQKWTQSKRRTSDGQCAGAWESQSQRAQGEFSVWRPEKTHWLRTPHRLLQSSHFQNSSIWETSNSGFFEIAHRLSLTHP